MSIQQKLTSFAITEARWITWLLIGFSIGGIAMVIERAVSLIVASAAFDRLRARLRLGPRRAACADPAIAGSGSGGRG